MEDGGAWPISRVPKAIHCCLPVLVPWSPGGMGVPFSCRVLFQSACLVSAVEGCWVAQIDFWRKSHLLLHSLCTKSSCTFPLVSDYFTSGRCQWCKCKEEKPWYSENMYTFSSPLVNPVKVDWWFRKHEFADCKYVVMFFVLLNQVWEADPGFHLCCERKFYFKVLNVFTTSANYFI